MDLEVKTCFIRLNLVIKHIFAFSNPNFYIFFIIIVYLGAPRWNERDNFSRYTSSYSCALPMRYRTKSNDTINAV